MVFRKSACPFGQLQTEMYLSESPFFKNSLARASGQVLMSVPAVPMTGDASFTSCMHLNLVNIYIYEINPIM